MNAIQERTFGAMPDGRPVELYALTNDQGTRAEITTYGGTLVSLQTPDRHGRLADMVLGFDDLDSYLGHHPYFGCLVGRYANRIAGASFSIAGRVYRLAANDGPNHLHGGMVGFDKRLWQAEPILAAEEAQLALRYFSPAGEEGYPGNLDVTVTYTLTAQNDLRIDYRARSDADTIVNLTNHSYFNLAGRGTIAAHELRLLAERFLPVNNQLIPLGEERDVHATAFDFTALRPIAVGLASADPQLKVAGGYDHCFILASGADSDAAAELYEPVSGRLLEIFTTQPGIQLYTGNNLNGTIRGRGGWRYDRHGGLCLETEHFPDAPNRPNFPSALLRAGEPYHETTTYRFSVR